MGDDQRRAVGRDGVQGILDLPLGAGIERRGGLVEEQDGRSFKDGAGDGDALFLAARKLEAALADRRLVAVGQAHDEIVDAGQPRRFLHLRRARRRVAVGDVVIDGVVEQHGVLGDHADGGAQGLLRHLADVLAVDEHAARIDVVEAEQDARDRRLARAAGADDGQGLAGGHRERDAFEHRTPGIVAEGDVFEFHPAAGDADRSGVRRVADLGRLAEKREHGLHVGERALDLAVDEAEEVERQVELDQVRVDQHEVADGHGAGGDAAAGHDHDRGEAGGDDGALADVEQRQRRPALHRGLLVALERHVEAPGLVVLVAEVLDGLEVEQAVDGLGAGLAVVLVHRPAELGAPLGDAQRPRDVAADGDEGDQGEPHGIKRPQHAADEQDLQEGGEDVEDHEGEHELDALGAALDGPADAAGLAVQMEAQGQPVQVAERTQPGQADGALGDLGEHRVADLAEGLGHDPGQAVGDEQADGHGQHRPGLRRQRVDRVLVEDRHDHVGALGQHQKAERDDHAHAHLRGPRRPQVGQQGADGLQVVARADRARPRLSAAHGPPAYTGIGARARNPRAGAPSHYIGSAGPGRHWGENSACPKY